MIKFLVMTISKMQHYIIWATAPFRWCPVYYVAPPNPLHSPQATSLLPLTQSAPAEMILPPSL